MPDGSHPCPEYTSSPDGSGQRSNKRADNARVKIQGRIVESRSGMSSELTWMPAHEMRELIGKGEVSPVEVTEHFLGRTEELEPKLHAFQVIDTEAARL